MIRRTLLLALLLSLVAGCGVRKDLHRAALDTIADVNEQIDALRAELERHRAAAASLDAGLQDCKAEVAAISEARDELLTDNAGLRAQLEEARKALRDAGIRTDALEQANESIQELLDASERALAEARRRQAAAEARNAIFRRVRERLQAMIDAGKLNVNIVRGRLVIDLKQDILFPSGKADLSTEGTETLTEIAGVLAEFGDRNFQIEGHTDNVPIKTSRFPSNWELSTARAVSVVKLFADNGMDATRLSAAGFGEFQPRVANDTDENKALNRRIEIVMLPDLQLLPDIVQDLEKP